MLHYALEIFRVVHVLREECVLEGLCGSDAPRGLVLQGGTHQAEKLQCEWLVIDHDQLVECLLVCVEIAILIESPLLIT